GPIRFRRSPIPQPYSSQRMALIREVITRPEQTSQYQYDNSIYAHCDFSVLLNLRNNGAGSIYSRTTLSNHQFMRHVRVLAKELEGFRVLNPAKLQTGRPNVGICTRVVDRDLVAQSVKVRTRETFHSV